LCAGFQRRISGESTRVLRKRELPEIHRFVVSAGLGLAVFLRAEYFWYVNVRRVFQVLTSSSLVIHACGLQNSVSFLEKMNLILMKLIPDATKKPQINRLLIVGTGLIGGSIGLATKHFSAAKTVIGFDADKETLQSALERGAVDQAAETLTSGLRDVDIAIMCVPPSSVLPVATELLRHSTQPFLLSDVCSVKREITTSVENLIFGSRIRFVPAHPIAGSVDGGIKFASAQLFTGRPVILSPTSTSAKPDTEIVAKFWEAIGAKVHYADVDQHDRFVAVCSHLPHLAAFALSDLAARATLDDLLGCIPRSFMDTTRVAKAPPELWADIVLANAREVASASESLRASLKELEINLLGGHRDALVNTFARAANFRRSFEEL